MLQGAYSEVMKQHKVGLMVLGAASLIGMLLLRTFWILSFFHALFLFSHKIVLHTRDMSTRQLVDMLGETPRMVWLYTDGVEVEIPFKDLQVGDHIMIHAGDMIPVDGQIASGQATIDQHRLTGEAQPVEKDVGDQVFAGTMVQAGTVIIEIEHAGTDTVAAQIGAILNRTAAYKSSLELYGEVVAERSVLPMLALGAVMLPLLGPTSAVAVMTCLIGFQIRITGPISVLNFLRVAADHGILIKDGCALERVPQVDTVVFDKTGTLTRKQPYVGQILPLPGYTEEMVLRYAAAAEYKQMHPIAHAIRAETTARHLDIPPITEAACDLGFGVRVNVNNQRVCVGSARFMEQETIAVPQDIQDRQEDSHAQGYSLVYVAIEDQLAGMIELRPTIRSEVHTVVEELKQRGLDVYIMSGDHDAPTRHLAKQLGIEHYVAEVLPGEKSARIEAFQRQGKSVCFVGDGINDSLALQTAHVSVSLRGATTIALDTAQVILHEENLGQLGRLFQLADDLKSNMRVNFLACTVPGITNVAAVYLVHSGIFLASLLSWIGITSGLTNAMRPLFKNRKEHRMLPVPVQECQSESNENFS